MLIVIAHNIRSAHNVGSILRTADGAGADEVWLTGYTPSPHDGKRSFLTASEKMIAKTALGAERSVAWHHQKSLTPVLRRLKKEGFRLVALERHAGSVSLLDDQLPPLLGERVALVVGNEVRGVHTSLLAKCDTIVEIPMYGAKNSLNVSVAFGVAVYALRRAMKR